MGKVTQYRKYIQTLLTQYAEDDVSSDEVEVQLIFDTERDHYQWMNVGWEQFNRVYRCIIHDKSSSSAVEQFKCSGRLKVTGRIQSYLSSLTLAVSIPCDGAHSG